MIVLDAASAVEAICALAQPLCGRLTFERPAPRLHKA
jgi:hypothetical protein